METGNIRKCNFCDSFHQLLALNMAIRALKGCQIFITINFQKIAFLISEQNFSFLRKFKEKNSFFPLESSSNFPKSGKKWQ